MSDTILSNKQPAIGQINLYTVSSVGQQEHSSELSIWFKLSHHVNPELTTTMNYYAA